MKNTVVIGWPLTPYTGWGSYGIQLAQALISRDIAQPIVKSLIQTSSECDLHWKLYAEQIMKNSKQLIENVEQGEEVYQRITT